MSSKLTPQEVYQELLKRSTYCDDKVVVQAIVDATIANTEIKAPVWAKFNEVVAPLCAKGPVAVHESTGVVGIIVRVGDSYRYLVPQYVERTDLLLHSELSVGTIVACMTVIISMNLLRDQRMLGDLYMLAKTLPVQAESKKIHPKRQAPVNLTTMLVGKSEEFSRTQKLTACFLLVGSYAAEFAIYSWIVKTLAALLTPIIGSALFSAAVLAFWVYVIFFDIRIARFLMNAGARFTNWVMTHLWPAEGTKGGILRLGMSAVSNTFGVVKSVGGWAWRNTLGRLFKKSPELSSAAA